MHWKLRNLIQDMRKDEECEDYAIYIPYRHNIITASLPGRGDYRPEERMVEQVELHHDGAIVIMKDDYDNPINEVDLDEDIKFYFYTAERIIG